MYTIVDIESTGGKFNEEGITEIAIYKFDGHEIVDQFSSLVNPEIPIQPFVVKLTGINNKMLRSAPKFYEVAKRIIEITENTTVVAHNALFDYRIMKLEFDRLGYKFNRTTLDTVTLSKVLIPDLESYSLGKLCKSLGIPVTDRHRATGDALATVKLFKILLNKDVNKKIITEHITEDKKEELAPKLNSILKDIPTSTGVYYIHKKGGEIVYIGKSNNIQKRINQHFLNKSSRAKKMQKDMVSITYEDTGSELISLLKETEEVLNNKPKYNKVSKKSIYKYGIYEQVDSIGYIKLVIEEIKEDIEPILNLTSPSEGFNILIRLKKEFKLCGAFIGLEDDCSDKETVDDHNQKISKLKNKLSLHNKNIAIIDKGRNSKENSVILIENGEYKGYGFVNLATQITNMEILKNIITPMKNSVDTVSLIQRYLSKKKTYKIIDFSKL